MLKSRVAQVRNTMQNLRLDGIVLFDAVSIRYLCGFSGSDAVLLVTGEKLVFATDSRYVVQAQEQVIADEIQEYREKLGAVSALVERFALTRVGFADKLVSVELLHQMQGRSPAVEWRSFGDAVRNLRQIKDAGEIADLRQAAAMNYAAYQAVRGSVCPGMKERDLAIELEYSLRKAGGEDKAFDFIVASGSRGALPHGVASDKQIERGELVTIDFGTRYNGYYSDETLTLAVGDVPARLREIYTVVLQAHDMAIDAVAVSMPAREVDKVARDHISARGFGEYFGHGLGHGVGLEIHELPVLSPRSEVLLENGMVFTVEPGIYIPGVGGVRIEDTVCLVDGRVEVLTRCPKVFTSVVA